MAAYYEKVGVDENKKQSCGLGLGFLDSLQQYSLPPPPPSLEVVPSSQVSSSVDVEFQVEPINFGHLTLLKGRVSTHQVFSLSNLDLVPGKYEGGLKLWEGSLDLIKALLAQLQNAQLNFSGKRILELGCGHGLPGILACLKGSSVVHFQDFNAEVLRCLTIPNVNANIQKSSQDVMEKHHVTEIRYFSGDWSEVHQILPLVFDNSKDLSFDRDQSEVPTSGYDIILMAETVYSISALQSLYELIKKCISRPHGVLFMAGKKHYFGVGGGTRRFLSVVEKDGLMEANLVAEVADGSSNVREVWKLSLK